MAKRGGAKGGAGGGGGLARKPQGGVIRKQAPKRAGLAKGAANRAPANANRGAKKGMTLTTIMPKKPAPKPSGRHTLLLTQRYAAINSRSWSDYASTPAALEAFIAGFEGELRKLNPGMGKLTYSVADLHTYVDSFHDLSLMVSNPQTKEYSPKGKDFLKSQLLQKFKSAAN